MAMEVDGAAILSAIARAPDSFGFSAFQVNTLAVNALHARLKDKAIDLEKVKEIAKAIGMHDFELSLDQMPGKDIASLTKRLDAKHPDLKESSEQWQRKHLVSLAEGGVEPSIARPKTPKVAKVSPPRVTAPKTGALMKSQALRPKSARKPTSKSTT